jgi:hypothetical protein
VKNCKDTVDNSGVFYFSFMIACMMIAAIGCCRGGGLKKSKPLIVITNSIPIPADLRICRDTNGVIDWRTHK